MISDPEVAREIGALQQRVTDLEISMSDQFQKGETRMKSLATTADVEAIRSLLIDAQSGKALFAEKGDVERLNNIVHNFTLGIDILTSSGKWLYRLVLAAAILMGAMSVLSGSFKQAGQAFYQFWN